MKLLFKTIPQLAWVLSSKSIPSFFRLSISLWYFSVSRKLGFTKEDFRMACLFNRRHITYYLRHVMDIAVLREVYIDKEYQWYPIIKPQVILDLGAHYGDTTLYYNALFPDAKIYAVEPSPENFERLNTHVKNIHNIIPLQFAIGSTNDTVELSVGNEPFGHSTVNTRYVASKTIVNQITLNKVFDDYKIEKADLIKFDIEGAEFSLFESINPKVFSKAYIGEIHLDLVDYPSLDKFTKLFNGAEVSVEEISKDRRYIIKALYI